MALNIKLDIANCYATEGLTENFKFSRFTGILKNGQEVSMGIHISDKVHPLIPEVYNLAFGPLNKKEEINDKVKLSHSDHSKLFSTIVFSSITFLENNKHKYLGIDGSNNARAYLYYRCIQNNFDYLNQFFSIYGVNYYIRILRKLNSNDDSFPMDENDIIAIPREIKKEEILKYDKLYNYFIFNLK